MSIMDQVGGIAGLMKLATNPAQVINLITSNWKGATHTLTRLRYLQEISSRSAILAAQTHNFMVILATEQRDATPEEIAGLDKMQMQLLQVCSNLYNFSKLKNEEPLDELRKAYGLHQSNAGTPQATGNGSTSQAGV